MKKNLGGRIFSALLAICMLATAILPLSGCQKLIAKFTEEPIQYTYVLVHGMGVWGESANLNNVTPYWGSTTGGISVYLRSQGHLVQEVSVGPFSSAWDRACELYAQLTGTRVDYGEELHDGRNVSKL